MIVWFDFENTPQVHFLLAIKEMLNGVADDFILSARNVFETKKLLESRTSLPIVITGDKHGKVLASKIIYMIDRFIKTYRSIGEFDISISCGSESAVWTSRLKSKDSIAFGDNDTARQWTYGSLIKYAFFPDAIPRDILIRQGIKNDKLIQYHGIKENIYVALYKPDNSFLNKIPFDNFVLVRPENLYANYIRKSNINSVVPSLLTNLIQKGVNILYLPKYEIDYSYYSESDQIFIPDDPINGLDACFFADAVFTGAGTFAREAACLGTPAVSFYAGKELLAVDKKLINERKVHYSRDVNDMVNYFYKSKKSDFFWLENKGVFDEVQNKLEDVINK